MPDHRAPRIWVEEQVIGMAVAIEIGNAHHLPPTWKGRPKRCPNNNVVIQIPDRRLARCPIRKQKIRMRIVVEVINRSPRRARTKERADLRIKVRELTVQCVRTIACRRNRPATLDAYEAMTRIPKAGPTGSWLVCSRRPVSS